MAQDNLTEFDETVPGLVASTIIVAGQVVAAVFQLVFSILSSLFRA